MGLQDKCTYLGGPHRYRNMVGSGGEVKLSAVRGNRLLEENCPREVHAPFVVGYLMEEVLILHHCQRVTNSEVVRRLGNRTGHGADFVFGGGCGTTSRCAECKQATAYACRNRAHVRYVENSHMFRSSKQYEVVRRDDGFIALTYGGTDE